MFFVYRIFLHNFIGWTLTDLNANCNLNDPSPSELDLKNTELHTYFSRHTVDKESLVT